MSIHPVSIRLTSIQVALLGLLSSLPSAWLYADNFPTDGEAERLGLVAQWRVQTERSMVGNGDAGIALWPHSTRRKQLVTITIGNRIVEQISANDFASTYEEQSFLNSVAMKAQEPLGLDGANAMADKIIARYRELGRMAKKVDPPIDQPVTYLVSVSYSGNVQAYDAETGQALWSTAVGDHRLPTFGPGINDSFVAITNGNELYLLDLETGRILGKRHLKDTPAATPIPIKTKEPQQSIQLVYLPSIIGAMMAIKTTDFISEPASMRFSGTLSAPVVASFDGQFISWPNKNSLFVAQAGSKFALWNRIEAAEPFRSAARATSDGFVATASNGMVYRLNFDQTDAIVWRQNLLTQVSSSPVVAQGKVLIITDLGSLVALNEATGEEDWTSDATDIGQVLAVSKKAIYAQRKTKQLVAIDLKSGKVIGSLPRVFAEGYVNLVNDRVILRSTSGALLCLREAGAEEPTFHAMQSSGSEMASKKNAPKTSADAAPSDAPAASVDSLFGGPPKMDTETPAPTSDDPFAPPPGNKPAADPFAPF